MKQRRIVTVLAIIAVTGAVSVPNSLAMTWRLDVGDRHVVDRGGLEGDPLIYTQAASGVPLDDDNYLRNDLSDLQNIYGGPYLYYGWRPTPHGDPLMQEQSREPVRI